jgi:predicted transcriptional regulator of viral defense system
MDKETLLKEFQKKAFRPLPYFSLDSYMQLAGSENRRSAAVQLSRWEKRGHIIRLKKGLYMTADFRDRHISEPGFLPMVSAIIQPQSYTSTTFELQAHGILTEITYPVTAVSFKRTVEISNALGDFLYQKIKPELYMGFDTFEYFGVPTHRATLAKALFDLLYLRPIPRESRTRNSDLAEELRLNLAEVPGQDREQFAGYVEQSDSEKMRDILDNFRAYIWRH